MSEGLRNEIGRTLSMVDTSKGITWFPSDYPSRFRFYVNVFVWPLRNDRALLRVDISGDDGLPYALEGLEIDLFENDAPYKRGVLRLSGYSNDRGQQPMVGTSFAVSSDEDTIYTIKLVRPAASAAA